MSEWTFFSNYGHVLVCLERDSEARLRDVATNVGITERAVQKIVRDLVDAGYLEVTKHGRCNRYRINKRRVLRHPLQSQCTVGQLLKVVAKPGRGQNRTAVSVAPAEPPLVSAAEPPVPAPAAKPSPPVASRDKPGVPRAAVDQPDPEAKKPATKKKKSAKEDAPVDTRQQGSLF